MSHRPLTASSAARPALVAAETRDRMRRGRPLRSFGGSAWYLMAGPLRRGHRIVERLIDALTDRFIYWVFRSIADWSVSQIVRFTDISY
jgi:hypothetical protein